MTDPSYRDELMAFRAATSRRPPNVQLPSVNEKEPLMKPLKLFTPLRLATIAALLAIGASSALALSPALRNFFSDFGLDASERAEQTQQQLDENNIEGTATPTPSGAIHIETDGKNAQRLLELMNQWTIVTSEGESITTTTGTKELAAKFGVANADAISVMITQEPSVTKASGEASEIKLESAPKAKVYGPFITSDTGEFPDVTSEQLRAEMKKRGMSDDLVEEIIRVFQETYKK